MYNLKTYSFIILILFFSNSLAQSINTKDRPSNLEGIWEYLGERTSADMDYIKSTPERFRIIYSSGSFTVFTKASSISTILEEGTYEITSDTTFKELIKRAANEGLVSNSRNFKFKMDVNNNLIMQWRIGNEYIEELWGKVDYPSTTKLTTTYDNKPVSEQQLIEIGKDLSVFKTPMALVLKKETNKKVIQKIKNLQLREVALLLSQNKYNNNYRYNTYRAMLSPDVLGKQLMIGDGYSKYENMTGVFLPIGQHIVLVNGIAVDKNVGLIIPDWNRRAPDSKDPTNDPAGWGIIKHYFQLKNGVNVIDIESFGGLAYIDYFSDNPEAEPPIEVHFVRAKVNGYFDVSKNNNKDWNNLIDNAIYPIIDAKGKHIQVAYPTIDCKKYAYNRGIDLINNYDTLIIRQYRIMGLIKYNKIPQNRILARVNYNYYMFRDEDGVAYMGTAPGNAMPLVVDPDQVIKGDPCWGFSHEVGHVHQLVPYLNWGGLGEVSNNIFSLYVTTSLGNKSRLAEQNNYQMARDSIIIRKISYLQDDDVFNRLVPFWQLQLYFSGIGNNIHFYPNLFEVLRKQSDSLKSGKNAIYKRDDSNPAEYQLNFVKKACEVSQVDLTDFFEKYGFFFIGNFSIDDYGMYQYNMTQEMVDVCKAEIKAMCLAKPLIDISTLTD